MHTKLFRHAIFSGHQGAVYTVSPSSNKGFFISGGSDANVVEWDLSEQIAPRIIARSAGVNYSLLAVAVLFLEMMRLSIIKYKIAGYFIYLMVLYPVMAVFVDLQDISEEFLMVYVLSMLAGFIYNAIVLVNKTIRVS